MPRSFRERFSCWKDAGEINWRTSDPKSLLKVVFVIAEVVVIALRCTVFGSSSERLRTGSSSTWRGCVERKEPSLRITKVEKLYFTKFIMHNSSFCILGGKKVPRWFFWMDKSSSCVPWLILQNKSQPASTPRRVGCAIVLHRFSYAWAKAFTDLNVLTSVVKCLGWVILLYEIRKTLNHSPI